MKDPNFRSRIFRRSPAGGSEAEEIHEGHEILAYGQIWSDMVRYGQIWSDMVRSGQIWSDMARYS